MNNTHGAFIVSWDFSHGNDKAILLVGNKVDGRIDVINAFAGQEAVDIYERLSKKKEIKNV